MTGRRDTTVREDVNYYFLSDPSPIIGNACHSLTHSLTDSLTDSCLVNLIDVTLACEDANSKPESDHWQCLSVTD